MQKQHHCQLPAAPQQQQDRAAPTRAVMEQQHGKYFTAELPVGTDNIQDFGLQTWQAAGWASRSPPALGKAWDEAW